MSAAYKTVLVVDDEENIVEVVRAYLEKEAYRVLTAYNGQEALDIFKKEDVDFIVLDLMMPGLSGEEVCKKIRIQSQVPILMLTAKAEEGDRIYGLDIGADDYMVKPFSPKELAARVRAILRRTETDRLPTEIIEFRDGDLIINLTNMEVKKEGRLVDLTSTEFKLLSLLAQNSGMVFSRDSLIERVLGFDYEGYDRTIDTHVKNIRQKIENKDSKYIITVYGAGYKFVEE